MAERSSGNPPRFLLIRLDGIGDALACVPLLEGLRRVHPDARFSAVCSPANKDVFARMQAIHVLGHGASPEALADELRGGRYTHAVVATEEVAGYALARIARAPRRAGFWHGLLEKPFKSLWQFAQLSDRVYRPAAWRARPEHEAERLYRLGIPFGARPPAPDDAGGLRPWLARQTPAAPIGPGALGMQIARKLTTDGWGPAPLAQLCAAALDASGLAHLELLAAREDEGLARAVLEQMAGATRTRASLSPPGGVAQWLGAIDALAALITPDTGAAHAAGMLGVPVIDLFDEARFDQLSRQWRPWAAAHRCIIKPPAAAGAPPDFGREIGVAAAQVAAQRTTA